MKPDPIPPEDYPAYPLPPQHVSPAGTHLRRYRAALRQKWWVLLITVILALSAAVFYLSIRSPKYSSQATMWVRGRFRVGEVTGYNEDLQNFFGTQIELIQSGKLAERALNRLKSANPDFNPPRDEKGQVILPVIRVTQAPKSAVFNLESVSTNAAFAQTYLDALMDEFLAYKKEVRAASSGDALASVSDQVYKQERELKTEQEKLSQFQRENNVALLQEQVTGGGNHLAGLNVQLSMLRLELNLLDAVALEQTIGAQTRTNLLTSISDPYKLAASASTAVKPPEDVATAKHQVEVLKILREQLSRYLRPKHPKIIKLDEEIARGGKVLEYYRQQTQDQLATAKEAMRLRIKSLEDSIKGLEQTVGDANRRLADLERVKANIQRQQSLYDRLLTLLQSVDINSTMDQENVTILERAGTSKPADRPPLIVLIAALLAGGFFGVGIIYLVARFDDRCDSLEELRGQFDEEIFGQVPEVASAQANGHLPLLQLNDLSHTFVESCRNLRSSLLYGVTQGDRPKTILVTSAAPEEGKSTIAANLAYALALGGARVLLIDGDLRRGQLHEALGTPSEPGFTEFAQQAGDVQPFLRTTLLPQLSFLPRGKPAHNSGELFLAGAFQGLLEKGRQQFDYLIMDSIPVFAADDTTTVAPKMDGVLFVVRSAHTSARMAHHALDLLYQRQVKVLGLVFNRVDSRSGSYRYYKYTKYYRAADKKA